MRWAPKIRKCAQVTSWKRPLKMIEPFLRKVGWWRVENTSKYDVFSEIKKQSTRSTFLQIDFFWETLKLLVYSLNSASSYRWHLPDSWPSIAFVMDCAQANKRARSDLESACVTTFESTEVSAFVRCHHLSWLSTPAKKPRISARRERYALEICSLAAVCHQHVDFRVSNSSL